MSAFIHRKTIKAFSTANNFLEPTSWQRQFTEKTILSLEFLYLKSVKTLPCCRRQWHPTPVLLPGNSHGRRNLVGCSPWDGWVSCDWATPLSLFTFMHWRRKWQPTKQTLNSEMTLDSLNPFRLYYHGLWYQSLHLSLTITSFLSSPLSLTRKPAFPLTQ